MEESNKNNFVGYEYRDVTVARDMESIWADSYANFGWLLEGTSSSDIPGINTVNLKFKRNRKIRNKIELTRLQRQFESCARQIENLEKSKNIGASAFAYGFGILGTAFMALSVFSHIGGMLPLSIIFAIPGFLGWILPYFCYVKIRNKKIEKVTPLIDEQYDIIYNTCEKANRLLEK
ncbi:hypothetical protein CPAST_c09410 [Clostridium pasteurianum DSM 525 = ATCC 6013]|uniref:Uncharacterized protein n=1 Tax=Clostridium pasteurianum DSM 525 = ATCC 6013 TaxID=1262449 RepID=A0A0H3IZR9_CLOPA|nr:hypothetical protein [Clostridium pasteurianum]AJA47041.1 hypothetical protein CPAST_c09410 [Clostridium pasteurianum DSM 525 = ATCC 6013]AJA51029.1 hypothetical protein CLPA_c09410 [Clostridium pasteurianum DSM 525 = ATCC 6013]AOZ74411.1 hypothetical protein AQ983_04560 [Clostridium pasteurianum DSM 525 = ATCC 6013]AOZ78208.1 hypothetical protein AQ984_04550 [Clostridium pasteurianum]ELP57499.1 hypothetical protein F502_19531 [Clostridium pasteurianum DSM 525 = ATCC 6013]